MAQSTQDEVEFTYLLTKCEIWRKEHFLTKVFDDGKISCLPFFDIEIWIVQNFQKGGKSWKSEMSQIILIETTE